MRKICGLSQKLSHLYFGIPTWLNMAVQLDDIVVIYQRCTVGLLALNGADPRWDSRRSASQFGGWLEIKQPTRTGDRSFPPKVIQETPDKSGIRGDIAQQSFALAPAQTRYDGFFEFGARINGPVRLQGH
jgi:hypothetical protein